MSPGSVLIRGGTIVSMDPAVGDLRRGDVLVRDGVIVDVAPSVEAGDADVIDATDMIVMPGLIDGHRHMWYSPLRGIGMDATLVDMMTAFWPRIAAHFTPHDVYVANRASILEALDNGITTVLDYCHIIHTPEHAPEAVRPYLELPIRVLFGVTQPAGAADGPDDTDGWDVARNLLRDVIPVDHPRIRLALAINGPDVGTWDRTVVDVRAARELGLPITMHIAGYADPPRATVGRLHEAGLLAEDMSFAHCNPTSLAEFALIAEAGARVVISPQAEMGMGMGLPPAAQMRAAGVPVAVGADAVSSATGDQFDEARTALLAERCTQAVSMIGRGEPVVSAAQLGMTTYEALQAITVNAARSVWLEDRIGSLTPGKAADIILLRGDDLNLAPLVNVHQTVIGNAHGGNVDTVLVGGEIVKRDGRLLVDVDRVQAVRELRETRDRIYGIEFEHAIVPPAGSAE